MKTFKQSSKPQLDFSLLQDTSVPRISPSQIRVWENCAIEWEWNYVHELKRMGQSHKAMDIGLYFHQLSHFYYQLLQSNPRLKPGDDFLIAAMNKRMQNDFAGVDQEAIPVMTMAINRMITFLSYQSTKIDVKIKVLGTEMHLELPVILPSGKKVILQGYVDLIYMDSQGRLHIRDHKTGGNPSTWQPSSIDLDSQLLFYALCWWLLNGTVPDQVEVSFISTAAYANKKPKPDTLFKYLPRPITLTTIENFWENLWRKIENVYDESRERLYKFDKECSKCSYKPLCDLEINGLDTARTISGLYVRTSRDYSVRPGEREAGEVSESHTSSDENFSISIPDVF